MLAPGGQQLYLWRAATVILWFTVFVIIIVDFYHCFLSIFFWSKSNKIDIDKRENFGIADEVYGFDGGSLNPAENTSMAKFVKLEMLKKSYFHMQMIWKSEKHKKIASVSLLTQPSQKLTMNFLFIAEMRNAKAYLCCSINVRSYGIPSSNQDIQFTDNIVLCSYSSLFIASSKGKGITSTLVCVNRHQ